MIFLLDVVLCLNLMLWILLGRVICYVVITSLDIVKVINKREIFIIDSYL